MGQDVNIENELPRELLITAGLIKGVSILNKFGRNEDVDVATVPEDISGVGGIYTGFPTTGTSEQLGVNSTNAADSATGTGARTIFIAGLDKDYKEITEIITLNGLTEVFTTQKFWRVHTANVQTAGSANFAVGSIRVRHRTTVANVFILMPPSTNQSNSCAFTIPADKVGILKNVNAQVRGGANAAADIFLYVRAFEKAARLRRPFVVSNSGYSSEIYGGIILQEKTDIHMRCVWVSGNNVDVSVAYDLVLMDMK